MRTPNTISIAAFALVVALACGVVVETMAAPPNLCPYIQQDIPSECTADSTCENIKCSLTWGTYFNFVAQASILPCASPASMSVDLQLTEPISLSWSHSWSMDESTQVDVPGASIGIGDLTAGLVMDGSIGGTLQYFDLTIAFDVCAEVPIFGEYCGADLTKYIPSLSADIPFVVLNETYDFSNLCSGGPPPPSDDDYPTNDDDSESGFAAAMTALRQPQVAAAGSTSEPHNEFEESVTAAAAASVQAASGNDRAILLRGNLLNKSD